MPHSPISKIFLEEREFFIKRDDLIDPHLAGNKYRKLYTLLETPKEKYKKIISYGGTQSNAMLALAALASKKSWRFTYYTLPLSKMQKSNKKGNYEQALILGMEHIEIEEPLYKDFIATLRVVPDDDTLIVDQGGASNMARGGLEVLAREIKEQRAADASLDFKAIATPSGTGTTALFLALSLPEYTIYTTPCVGDSSYLQEQMRALSALPKNLHILEPNKKFHFAKPYREFYEMYQKLQESGVEFDMLYAPAMWLALLEQTQESILYVHSGGASGNESMKERYSKKFGVAF
jgi:1-aminocyclopropane-1-carboxylate deaminase/D-cysteine desulfhydrase-like pyridoxal-dependent ACC family enzyme